MDATASFIFCASIRTFFNNWAVKKHTYTNTHYAYTYAHIFYEIQSIFHFTLLQLGSIDAESI